jgi:hypothetical protein
MSQLEIQTDMLKLCDQVWNQTDFHLREELEKRLRLWIWHDLNDQLKTELLGVK